MDECKICGKHPEETHHIKEQCTADKNNMIDHHHKNKKHNLVPLCKECHKSVTYGKLRIYGWKQTSRGPKLDYEYINEKTKQSTIDKDKINIILKFKDLIESECITKKLCINQIDSEYGFRPTLKQINDVLHGNY